MQVIHVCEWLVVLTALALVSTAAAQTDILVRDLTPEDEHDWSLTRRLSGISGLPRKHGVWPRIPEADTLKAGIELIAEVDGLVVGRVHLEAHHHPYCELVNLGVRPDYEGMGVATSLVREAVTRARSLGLRVMVLQEDLGGGTAHDIYERAGFLPATRGDMLRMVKLLDVPSVSMLLKRHAEPEFTSEPAPDWGERCQRLAWQAAPDDSVALYLFGGSCQFDSDGCQPVIGACEIADGTVDLAARLECATEAGKGKTVELLVTIENRADTPLEGCVRAMLLPNTEVAPDGPREPVPLTVEPGQEQTIAMPVRISHEFRCDFLRFGSYPSVPLTVEVCWERGSVLLSRAVKVKGDWDGRYPG